MRFWLRQSTVILGTSKYSLDELNYKFKVTFEDRPMVSIAQVELYNLAPSTRSSVQKGDPLIINAGYKGDVGCIFVGAVAEFKHEPSSQDIITKITATDSMEQWLGAYINKTYDGPISAQEVLDDLLNVFGVEVAMVKLKTNKQYKRGKVCVGKLKDILTQIACADCESRFLPRSGQIIINPPEEGLQTGFLLTPETGLLKESSTADSQDTVTKTNASAKDTRAEQIAPDSNNKRSCLLNYRIGCADLVVIRDSMLNGTFLVVKGEHSGSRTGDWKTTLEVIPA